MDGRLSRRAFFALAPAVALPAPNGDQEPEPAYSAGSWLAQFGTRRARLRVRAQAEAVSVRLRWRRRDDPAGKDLHIVEAATGRRVRNLARIRVDRHQAELVFEPYGPGEYHLYFAPYTANRLPHAYAIQYTAPQDTADAAWVERHRSSADLPRARVIDIQGRGEFHRPDPMELAASEEETRSLLDRYPARPFLVFAESRQHPVRMYEGVPLRWIEAGPSQSFHGGARCGEFYVFQLAVWAAREPVEDVLLDFGALRSASGETISAAAFRCFNLGGKDWLGRPFQKSVAIPKGRVGALWCGVEVPRGAAAGTYTGDLVLRAKGSAPVKLRLALEVEAKLAADSGDGDSWRMARLRWLDSTIGLGETVPRPYTSLAVRGTTVACLGREVRFGTLALPGSIRANGREILAAPIALVVERASQAWKGGAAPARVVKAGAAAVKLASQARESGLTIDCSAKMEFDGHIDYRLRLRAEASTQLSDVRLEIPLRPDAAEYMCGLCRKGGTRPAEWQWRWDIDRAVDSVWLGAVDAGLQCKLKGPRDAWHMSDLRPEGIPAAWGNGGRGGASVRESAGRVTFTAFSGPREMAAGDELEFCFSLLVTPVKPLDAGHWAQRYFHIFAPPEEAVKAGATIVNIHHGYEVNPHINYPFLTAGKLAAYVSEAHEKGLKAKIYYTVRELSSRAPEMWALRSLGEEILEGGPGGGDPWLREHFIENYKPAWHHFFPDGEVDAAVATTALSRWHNFYLEGLRWLAERVEIDGLYLDGIGYNREVMKRVRRVLDTYRPGSLIDFHSGNEFPYNDMRISPANKYLEHFPYIDSLWFGEMYDYNESPDYWLVEISGIPFGLFGEMLERNGNPWRGMIYGMTARYYQGAEPKHIWKVWDEFGIQQAGMRGYWDKACPVRTGRGDILATAYVKPGATLIALASWAKQAATCRLEFEWTALGLDANTARLHAQEIPGFQPAAQFTPADPIPVEPGKGWLLELRCR
jgi:hypothetical protein